MINVNTIVGSSGVKVDTGKIIEAKSTGAEIKAKSFCSVAMTPDTYKSIGAYGNPYSSGWQGVCEISEGKFFVVYPAYSYCYPTACIVTVDANGDITYGPQYTLVSSGVGNNSTTTSCCLMPDGTIFVMTAYYSNYVLRCSVSDDDVITCTAYKFSQSNVNTYNHKLIPISDSRVLLLHGSYPSSVLQGAYFDIADDGVTVTEISRTTIANNFYVCPWAEENSFVKIDENKYCVIGAYSSNNRTAGVVFSFDGNTISAGARTTFTARASENYHKACCYDGNHVRVVYCGNESQYYFYNLELEINDLSASVVKDEYITDFDEATSKGLRNAIAGTMVGNSMLVDMGSGGFATIDVDSNSRISYNTYYSTIYYFDTFVIHDGNVWAIFGATASNRSLNTTTVSPLVPTARPYDGDGTVGVTIDKVTPSKAGRIAIPQKVEA